MRLKSIVTILFCAVSVWAQSERGTIAGEVADSSGGAVPGASNDPRRMQIGAKFQF